MTDHCAGRFWIPLFTGWMGAGFFRFRAGLWIVLCGFSPLAAGGGEAGPGASGAPSGERAPGGPGALPATATAAGQVGTRGSAVSRSRAGGEDEGAILAQIQERTPRDLAIERALGFLLKAQRPDGSFGEMLQNALTGLSVMALLAGGHTPDHPVQGEAVRRGIQAVLERMDKDGYLGGADKSRMYGHGICTLMLAEAAGMTADPVLEHRILSGCRRGVEVILRAQAVPKAEAHRGGWRYLPNSTDSDLSLTGWQTMSLRAAKDIGIEVPEKAIQDAVGYIRRMADPAGGFGYEARGDRSALRGVGMLALPVCGVYDAPELTRTTALMFKDPPKWQGPFFFYGTYYASVGMYQMGEEAWGKYHPLVAELLLKNQLPDGSWPDPPENQDGRFGAVYRTALATLALAVHYHLLPIYQR